MHTRISQIVSKIQEINSEEYFKFILTQQEYLYFNLDKRFFCVKDSEIKTLFDDLCYEMWQDLDASVIENIYEEYFRSKLKDFVLDIYLQNEKMDDDAITSFKRIFTKIPTNNFTLISKFYGVSIIDQRGFIQLGNFKLCNYKYYRDNYHLTYHLMDGSFSEPQRGEIDNCFIIHENIQAIDKKKAEFVFHNKIEQFINTLLFSTRFCTERNSLISYKDENIITKFVVINKDDNSWNIPSSNKSIINPIYNLKQEFFNREDLCNLFVNIDKNKLGELEDRVQRAVDWYGLSMRNNNLQQRYTFLSIALESLLSNKKNGLMDQSITNRLREYSAFLYSDDKSERKEVYDDLSKLYNHRSKISHSGKTENLKYKDYMRLLSILYKVITKVRDLIKDGLSTDSELTAYINKLKGIGE
ncbi:MAG: hypothetical protein ACI37Z_01275 [Candidatus Gastranaerophilaceae bacterium]